MLLLQHGNKEKYGKKLTLAVKDITKNKLVQSAQHADPQLINTPLFNGSNHVSPQKAYINIDKEHLETLNVQ